MFLSNKYTRVIGIKRASASAQRGTGRFSSGPAEAAVELRDLAIAGRLLLQPASLLAADMPNDMTSSGRLRVHGVEEVEKKTAADEGNRLAI